MHESHQQLNTGMHAELPEDAPQMMSDRFFMNLKFRRDLFVLQP
jgi:hypothetical protein